MPAARVPAATAADFFRVEAAGMQGSLLPVGCPSRSPPRSVTRPHVYGGGGAAGGGGPSTGTVMGGSPGICTTVEPISGGRPGIAPGGGGRVAAGIRFLTGIVMIEPATVSPAGDVPTTVPADDPL